MTSEPTLVAPIAWLLRQAAQDHTHLYFALLPSDLCQLIDRHFDWHLDRVLKSVQLDTKVESAWQVLSAEGEVVVVISTYESSNPRRMCLLRPSRELRDERRVLKIPEWLIGVDGTTPHCTARENIRKHARRRIRLVYRLTHLQCACHVCLCL